MISSNQESPIPGIRSRMLMLMFNISCKHTMTTVHAELATHALLMPILSPALTKPLSSLSSTRLCLTKSSQTPGPKGEGMTPARRLRDPFPVRFPCRNSAIPRQELPVQLPDGYLPVMPCQRWPSPSSCPRISSHNSAAAPCCPYPTLPLHLPLRSVSSE